MSTPRKYIDEALQLYSRHYRFEKGIRLDIKSPPETGDDTTLLLQCKPHALAYSTEFGSSWMLHVQPIWQYRNSTPKTVHEIAAMRRDFFLLRADGNQWKVKPDTALFYRLQSMMFLHSYDHLHLICFNPRNDSMLIVQVPFDISSFSHAMGNLVRRLYTNPALRICFDALGNVDEDAHEMDND